MPRQRGTPITKQAKVDLGSHVQGDNIQQLMSGAVSNALHLFMVCWPFCFRLLFEFRSVFENLRPSLLAVL
jgi:hypothetical protein